MGFRISGLCLAVEGARDIDELAGRVVRDLHIGVRDPDEGEGLPRRAAEGARPRRGDEERSGHLSALISGEGARGGDLLDDGLLVLRLRMTAAVGDALVLGGGQCAGGDRYGLTRAHSGLLEIDLQAVARAVGTEGPPPTTEGAGKPHRLIVCTSRWYGDKPCLPEKEDYAARVPECRRFAWGRSRRATTRSSASVPTM